MARADLTWKVGGSQGEGIDSSGEIFALTLHRMGYYVYGYRHFQSLIIGGHTNYKVRISTVQRRHRGDGLDLLVAFDATTVSENLYELSDGSVILYDSSSFTAEFETDRDIEAVGIPMTEIAKEHGSPRMKNMVAMGATAAVYGLEPSAFDHFIQERYGKHGEKVVEANRRVVGEGYESALKSTSRRLEMPALPSGSEEKQRVFMHGNDAIALGSIVAGCRLVAAYPITPATEILYSVLKLLPKYGGVVIQAEDEMSACLMAVGSNYTGVRAMTTTSGPGFSLMTETLGLAGVSETPVVIVDVQRAGPSTGMPTKTEQGDAFQAIFSAHGEIQRIVLTPATVEDCFYDIQRAFNLADEYQCPVIVLTDLVLGLSKQTVDMDDLDFERIPIRRGAVLTQEELDKISGNGGYKRYALTESGISPRALPGQTGGVHMALSYEHDERGEEMDEPTMRVRQTNKRVRKMTSLQPDEVGVSTFGDERPELLLIGWGSTLGQITEAAEALADAGIRVGRLHLSILHPFPAEAVNNAIEAAERVMVVENNAFGQLLELIKQHTGHHERLDACLKFDGDPFRVYEILDRVYEVYGYMSGSPVTAGLAASRKEVG